MSSKKAQKAQPSKKAAKRAIASDRVQHERERVTYTYDAARDRILAASRIVHKDTQVVSEFSENIARDMINKLASVATDQKKFRAIVHAELGLLSKLHCDANSRKIHKCTNTQYDSLKKLAALVIQVAATKAQQTRKAKKAKKAAAVSS